ncbi:MAG TPA: hypothetical protein PK931_13010, partial [Saprospiraceae bacterium]|nr:hypothetical protein [Saprospiraceae bacterium]
FYNPWVTGCCGIVVEIDFLNGHVLFTAFESACKINAINYQMVQHQKDTICGNTTKQPRS